MSSVTLNDDAYVDVDEIFNKYKKSRTKLIFLVSAIVLIFLGTIGGYTALQMKTAKLEATSQSTLDFARITVQSNFCTDNPKDATCEKAKAIVDNPEKATDPDPNSTAPADIPELMASEPLATSFAIITQQPWIIRLK